MLVGLTLLAAAGANAGGESVGVAAAVTPSVSHDAFERILADIVRGEDVDYPRLRERHHAALDAYLDDLARANVERLERDAQLAFYINLYNATVLREVARRFEPGYDVTRDSFALFDDPTVRLRARTISLNELEHRIVRPGFEEPRIHVALVCAARSCPPLLPRAYTADDLESLLEANMARFITSGTRNRIDAGSRRVRLSRLFDWYAEDFGGPAGRLAYVDRYSREDLTGFGVEFIEYDWSLNLAPR